MKKIVICFISAFLFSCSGEEVRIKKLKQNLNIELPQRYKTIKNSTIGEIADFEIQIELQLNTAQIKEIIFSIQKKAHNLKWERYESGFSTHFENKEGEIVIGKIDTIHNRILFNLIHI